MTASIPDIVHTPSQLQPASANELWAQFHRRNLEEEGLEDESGCEEKWTPAPETLDAFFAVNQHSVKLDVPGLALVTTDAFPTRREACAGLAHCAGWIRFSRIGYDTKRSEALVHIDQEDPSYHGFGMGHCFGPA